MNNIWDALLAHDNASVAFLGIVLTALGSTVAWWVGRRTERRVEIRVTEAEGLKAQLSGWKNLAESLSQTIQDQNDRIEGLETQNNLLNDRLDVCEADRRELWRKLRGLSS